MMAAHMLNT